MGLPSLLAVAGFSRDDLDITIEENQLVIRGRQEDDQSKQYLYRGIAARQFRRTFVLADGIDILGADLRDGLFSRYRLYLHAAFDEPIILDTSRTSADPGR